MPHLAAAVGRLRALAYKDHHQDSVEFELTTPAGTAVFSSPAAVADYVDSHWAYLRGR